HVVLLGSGPRHRRCRARTVNGAYYPTASFDTLGVAEPRSRVSHRDMTGRLHEATGGAVAPARPVRPLTPARRPVPVSRHRERRGREAWSVPGGPSTSGRPGGWETGNQERYGTRYTRR